MLFLAVLNERRDVFIIFIIGFGLSNDTERRMPLAILPSQVNFAS